MTIGYFHRWYDMDLTLSELVQTIQALSEPSKVLFGLLLLNFTDRVVQVRGHSFFTQLEWQKLLGILKSKRGKRWYDLDPVLHQAFNKLYSLSDADKDLIAKALYTPILVVRRYEEECLSHSSPPDIGTVCNLVETCFTQGSEQATHS